MDYKSFLNLPIVKTYSSNKKYFGSDKHKEQYLKTMFEILKTEQQINKHFKKIIF